MPALDPSIVAAVDSTGQAADILDLAAHLRDALWRVESAALGPRPAAGLAIAGMGGSASGARIALAIAGERAGRPVELVHDYRLPAWVGEGWVVLCLSYSGNTEEVLHCYDQAAERGVYRIVATTGGPLAERARRDGAPVIPLPGGFQPRATVGYSTVIALEVAARCGIVPALRDEVEGAADLLETLAGEWGPAAGEDTLAKTLARELAGTCLVVVGSELTAPVAYRWKCQVNENVKLPAFSSELPELDHNEIEGWAEAEGFGPFSVVFLDDGVDLHPRTRQRSLPTEDEMARGAGVIRRVTASDPTRTQRAMRLVLLGDLVTLYLAVLRGVDPADIQAIDRLKAALA